MATKAQIQKAADAIADYVRGVTTTADSEGETATVALDAVTLHDLFGRKGERPLETLGWVGEHIGQIWARLPVGWFVRLGRGDVLTVRAVDRGITAEAPLTGGR